MMPNSPAKQLMLAWFARQLVGITEQGNAQIVNKMRKASDGVAAGEPWCACFVQHCAREVDELDEILHQVCQRRQSIPNTESTQALWNNAEDNTRRMAAEIGSVAVWRLQGDPTKGHCGIVVEAGAGYVVTVEGNTSATGETTEAERNGRGVWEKRRIGGNIPGFELLGYLLPWG